VVMLQLPVELPSRGVRPWKAECGLSEMYSQRQRSARICASGAVVNSSVFRNSSLNVELFTTVQEARLLAEQHRIEYNTYRPHSALQGRTPLEILQQWRAD